MATMNSGLGGGTGYGENSFATLGAQSGDLDDGSRFVDITSVFGGSGINFFGTNYTGLYINTNGLITFEGPNTSYSPSGISGLTEPALVPFWTDLDISSGGDIIYDFDTVNGAVTITWLDVAPYEGTGANSFQVVLTDTGGENFDIEFIYETIEFTKGYTSGTDFAEVGVTDGGVNDFVADGSGDDASLAAFPGNDFDNSSPAGVFSLIIEGGAPVAAIVEGTAGDDILVAGSTDTNGVTIGDGDDVIDGAAGDDLLGGGFGDDTILGGAGADTLQSGSTQGGSIWTSVTDNDNLIGTTGNDHFSFSAGTNETAIIRFNNSTSAGDGDGLADYVRIETTNDNTDLTIGDFDMGTDKIVLPEAYASFSFSSGSGFTDVDITYTNGNVQSFTLFHDTGTFDVAQVFTTVEPTDFTTDNDSLTGGDDADTFLFSDDFGNDTLVGGNGGNDSDLVDVSALSGAVTITYSGDQSGTMTQGSNTASFSQIESFLLTGSGDTYDASVSTVSVTVDGGAGDDSLIGGEGSDYVDGGAGADTIFGGDGDDYIEGGGGNDLL